MQHQDDEEPLTPSAEQQSSANQDDAPITFDARQQEKVNELIKGAMGRASREVRTELAAAKLEIEQLKAASGAVPNAADQSQEIALLKAELSAAKAEKSESSISAELMTAAAAEGFFDPALATQILRNNVRLVDGKMTVVESDGTPKLNPATFEPMTVSEFVADFGRQKSFMVRSNVRPGIGSTESKGPSQRAGLDKLFGKGATVDAPRILNDIAKRDIGKFRAMRQAAKAQGLIK